MIITANELNKNGVTREEIIDWFLEQYSSYTED